MTQGKAANEGVVLPAALGLHLGVAQLLVACAREATTRAAPLSRINPAISRKSDGQCAIPAAAMLEDVSAPTTVVAPHAGELHR